MTWLIGFTSPRPKLRMVVVKVPHASDEKEAICLAKQDRLVQALFGYRDLRLFRVTDHTWGFEENCLVLSPW